MLTNDQINDTIQGIVAAQSAIVKAQLEKEYVFGRDDDWWIYDTEWEIYEMARVSLQSLLHYRRGD